jgi:hypothetical protein
MGIDIEEMGPVDYMVVEFPHGRLSGKGLPYLVDLVDRGIIRILDVAFVRKLEGGKLIRIDLHSLESGGMDDLRVFDGAASGLLGEDDLESAGNAIEDDSMAGIVIYENLWAAPLAVALRRGGAQLVSGGRIPIQALLASLDAAEAASHHAA